MKNTGASILVLVTCIFAAFTLGFFIGKNQNSSPVEISIAESSAAPNTDPEADSDTDPSISGSIPTAAEDTGLININTATHAELMTLPGIGEVIAQRIIDYRTEFGDFRAVEDLLNVSGIGEKKLEAIIDLVTVGG